MWQKIKCLLGCHKWKDMCCDGYCAFAIGRCDCYKCPYGHEQNIICKHCGKVKMTVAELIKEFQNLENINGKNLLCLNVVVTGESCDNTIKSVERCFIGESRKVKLKV